MGIWRTLYREGRLILGLSAPAELDTHIAERVAGELKGDIGGKRSQHGEDWFLESKFEGREVKTLCVAAGRRVIIQVASTLETGPLFVLVSGNSERETPAGEKREAVTGGIFAQGPARDVHGMVDLWKALPTGARGNITSLMNKHKGEFRYEDGFVRIESETPLLEGPSAKYNVKSLLQSMVNVTGEIEAAWSKL